MAIASLALACASPVFALPVTLSAGQSVGFNFNFGGETPPPPYERLITDFVFGDTDSDGVELDRWRVIWFNGLDLQDGEVRSFVLGGDFDTFSQTFRDTSPGIVDGLFSVQVIGLQGNITLESLTSIGFGSEVDTGNQLPTPIQPNPVPEPTTGALVVLALAAAGALSRRRRFA